MNECVLTECGRSTATTRPHTETPPTMFGRRRGTTPGNEDGRASVLNVETEATRRGGRLGKESAGAGEEDEDVGSTTRMILSREEVARLLLENGGDGGALTRAKIEGARPDRRDLNTPDNWVPRHEALVRLTGTHPFNVEPPLSALMKCGGITPAELHFVRNHGAAQMIKWSEHRLTIEGEDVKRTKSYTMNELLRKPSMTIPCLLVCAGNRRKEQNMYEKTIGFGWGAAGLSNSLWTGVPLRVLLRECGVTEVTAERRFVCFEGPKGELPKGKDGTYGTSIPLGKALDPAEDVMVCYAQNGESLRPDHGFPIRLLIPGYIGGRMIKFLTTIRVTKEPSDNFYHFRDNRIMPPGIDAATADKENWWEKPEYIFNELNINSAISSPAHDECVPLDQKTYAVKGYAYSGGGRAVTRVEVSVNGGYEWRLAKIIRPCKPNMYGKHWCWVFWELDVDVAELASAKEVMCRAWDEANNRQPRDFTWNLMGMGNNCYFRVKLAPKATSATAPTYIHCEHPTEPGALKGGWMGNEAGGWKPIIESLEAARAGESLDDRVASASEVSVTIVDDRAVEKKKKDDDVAVAKTDAAAPPSEDVKYISMEEVEKHNTEGDCWIVVKGKVYDVNAYLKEGLHPGGNASITMNAGEDVTEDFEAVHSAKAWKQLDPFYIGELGTADQAAASATAATTREIVVVEDEAPKKQWPEMPKRGPVHLVNFYKEHKDAYGDALLGRDAEAAAFDRMWAGAKNIVSDDAPMGLNPKKWLSLKIEKKVPLSHDSVLLRLKLESDAHQCGMPVGHHVYLRGEWNGKKVMRAYTPSSLNGTLGAVELVIKIYYSDVHEAYPEGGALTQYLHHLNEGDAVDVKGPVGHIKYAGRGLFKIDGKDLPRVKRMTLLGGGTGVAPMLQLIVAVLADADDETELSFIYANKTEDDVLLKYTLDRLEREHPGRFKTHYMISKETWAKEDKTDAEWSEDRITYGRINLPIIQKHGFAADGTSSVAVMCGPPAFEEDACIPALKTLGYPDECIIRY